jgi:hypothetical protein
MAWLLYAHPNTPHIRVSSSTSWVLATLTLLNPKMTGRALLERVVTIIRISILSILSILSIMSILIILGVIAIDEAGIVTRKRIVTAGVVTRKRIQPQSVEDCFRQFRIQSIIFVKPSAPQRKVQGS